MRYYDSREDWQDDADNNVLVTVAYEDEVWMLGCKDLAIIEASETAVGLIWQHGHATATDFTTMVEWRTGQVFGPLDVHVSLDVSVTNPRQGDVS